MESGIRRNATGGFGVANHHTGNVLSMGINVGVGSGIGVAVKHSREGKGTIAGNGFVNAKLTRATNFYLTDRNFASGQVVGRFMQAQSVDPRLANGAKLERLTERDRRSHQYGT
jgi:hypothetical protein